MSCSVKDHHIGQGANGDGFSRSGCGVQKHILSFRPKKVQAFLWSLY